MGICIDSNILVYAFNPISKFHDQAEMLLEKFVNSDGFIVTDISLIEFYQIITNKKKLEKAISPGVAREIIRDIVLNKKIQIIENNIDILNESFRTVDIYNIKKYDIYDHLIAHICKHYGIKDFYTANSKDFERYEFLNVINPFEEVEEHKIESTEQSLIPLSVPSIQGNEWKYIKECLDTEWVSPAGKYVEKFENDICEFTGAKYAVACVNGTAALQISLILAGIKPDDEVIVPTVTFIAPINVVRYLNAEPIFMDCDKFYNLDIDKTIDFIKNETIFRDSITYNKKTGKRISAIIPVHVFGNAVDLEKLIPICKERNIKVVEDATESLGTYYTKGTYKDKHTGTIGDLGCYSFNGNKIITTGGGGMIVTADVDLAEKARYLTTQAKDDPVRYIHDEIGYNFRLTNIQAALGVAQLERLPEYIQIKRKNYELYKTEINKIEGLHIAETPDYSSSNHWFYCLQVDIEKYGKDREELMQYLSENKIQTRPLWYLNHLQKPYKDCQSYKPEKAFELLEKTLNIPSSVNLTGEQIQRVLKILENG
jgi:aminotransferase in exopolysaccharide biosynthesis